MITDTLKNKRVVRIEPLLFKNSYSTMSTSTDVLADLQRRIKYLESILDMKNIDIDAVNEYGWTELHHAVAAGDYNSVKNLLRAGANVYAKDKHGRSPLHYAVKYQHQSINDILRRYGASYRVMDYDGRMPGYFAIHPYY